LAQRLTHALDASNADIAVACTQDRAQPVFSLMHTSICDSLRRYMAQGGRKIATWMAQQKTVEVPFDSPGDDQQAFFNTNTPEQLSQLERS
jgi:molybdopterin-guanine dinucleotide biosynthesis protein A